ncbi:uncharacterized protein A1O9_09095 [Exophiala aquamarina CBS 119918]|uniref:F-box domain-containing protein n=1 Tax=Exophiala aquamarina CBS 119918 TaxID=1182545 RepID=A0A072P5U9_9EURO|nr:uncharacterized protein A1O9_09095 [Exophiala aquamarina CBS 119918]KEF54653.1 hypothetical protein A1O9_09095 [Exophiala aquamarina CBS 119918]
MEDLPTELVDHLCYFIDRSSLKHFRLLCKAYAHVAEKHLFHNFEFRLYPSHHRLYQLEKLASNKSIAPYLKCISFQSGVQLEYADYRYWQAQIYHELNSAWSRSLASEEPSKLDYTKFHENLQARFAPDFPVRYDLYRWHLDQQAAAMADPRVQESLIRTFNSLSNSNSNICFKVIMAEPQIRLEELEAFNHEEYQTDRPYDLDYRRRISNRRQHCMTHFINFLEAARLSRCPLTVLEAVDMPHELLTRLHANGQQVLEDIFRHLSNLSLRISSLPHSDWLSRSDTGDQITNNVRHLWPCKLTRLLNNSPELRDLHIDLPIGKEAEYSFDLFDRTNIDQFPRLWVSRLKSLSLSRFSCRWGDLKALLHEGVDIHALALRDCRMETYSMVDVLDYLAKRHFHSVSILGTWYVDHDEGEWHWHTEDDFTACKAATSYEGPYTQTGMRSRLECYMHSGGECPLPAWTATNRAEDIWEMLGDTSFHYLPGPPQQ